MPNLPADDPTLQDLDPLELADRDDELTPDDDDTSAAVPHGDAPVADLVPELEQDIVQILVAEEPTPKQKTQMISQDLINRELTPDDLMDQGSI
jgi:hypothetical protein